MPRLDRPTDRPTVCGGILIEFARRPLLLLYAAATELCALLDTDLATRTAAAAADVLYAYLSRARSAVERRGVSGYRRD